MSKLKIFLPLIFSGAVAMILIALVVVLNLSFLEINCFPRLLLIFLMIVLLFMTFVLLRNLRLFRLTQDLSAEQKGKRFFLPEYLFFGAVLLIFFGLGISLPKTFDWCRSGIFSSNQLTNNNDSQEEGEKIDSAQDDQEKDKEGSELQMNGPYQHAIYFATSDDGINWKLSDEAIEEHASVPELVELNGGLGDYSQGTLLSYFVDATELTEPGQEEIGLISSTDGGKTWSEKKLISFSGLSEDITPVDPSVFQLDDGRLRLYFFDISGRSPNQQPAGQESELSESIFYSALSEDGENFVLEDKVFSAPAATDPEVIFFNNQWLMYYAGAEGLGVATSSDGVSFSEVGSLKMTGIPGAMVVNDQVYVYSCQMGVSYAVSDDGTAFGLVKKTSGFMLTDSEQAFCDGSPVVLLSGGYAMMIKSLPSVPPGGGIINDDTEADFDNPPGGGFPNGKMNQGERIQ